MNDLAFELVVSVVVSAAVLDLVSTLDAHVLVAVLVRRVSSVVLVLGEIVVVVDPCVIAVSMVATKTVVTHVVFAAETLSVAAVVSDPVVSDTMFGALIGIVSSTSHQHLSHFSLCG